MEKLTNIDQYYDLIKKVKKRCKISFTNMYCMPEQVQRYINLGRISFVEEDYGLFFFLDEEKYYKLCLYVDSEVSFSIPELDKKVLFRVIYRGENDKKSNKNVEQYLKKCGFVKMGTSQQILGDIEAIIEKKKILAKSVSIVNRMGYQIVKPTYEMFEGISEVLEQVSFIQDYHEDFHSEEEIKRNMEQGGYQCIVDQDGAICAVTISWPQADTAEGTGIAVLEQYRKLGFASAICYARLNNLREMGVRTLTGWVRTDNNESIRYHNSMQFDFQDRYADEWILEKIK